MQVCGLYHFTDEFTKDMREGRGWYAAWDVGRRLFFIILFYVGVNIDSSLVSVSGSCYFASYLRNSIASFAIREQENQINHDKFQLGYNSEARDYTCDCKPLLH